MLPLRLASRSSRFSSRKGLRLGRELGRTLYTVAASLKPGSSFLMVSTANTMEASSVASAVMPMAWPPALLISVTTSL